MPYAKAALKRLAYELRWMLMDCMVKWAAKIAPNTGQFQTSVIAALNKAWNDYDRKKASFKWSDQ